MHNYIVIDGMLNGTGVRDYYEGGYIDASKLAISRELFAALQKWLARYWEAFYAKYNDPIVVENLDVEGVLIARLIKQELNCKVTYYSDAKQQKISI